MIIIKLGGSVITRKGEYATLNSAVMENVARELSEYRGSEPLVIVHGAGSFGHILAKQYNLKDPVRDSELPKGIALVQRDVRKLNLLVMEPLLAIGLPVVSVPPALATELDDGALAWFDEGMFARYLDIGTIPVTFGDVVPDRKRGVSILSGDTIMERLVEDFPVSKAVFVLDVDGFFDRPPSEEGAILYTSLSSDDLRDALLKDQTSGPVSSKDITDVVDITGSIRGKMESALRIADSGTDTYLVNGHQPSRLSSILNDRPAISTKIEGVRR
jgi:isopentenyl phosphate kinase